MYRTTLLLAFIIIAILISCNNKIEKPIVQQSNTKSIIVNEPTKKADSISTLSYADFKELNELIRNKSKNNVQHYTIDASENSTTVCENGLRVKVNPTDLILRDGSNPIGKIDMQIIEAQNVDDFIENNAPTVCNGSILSSGGSYYINLTNNGKPLSLKSNKSIQIDAPKINGRAGMQLYYGDKNTDNLIAWKATGISFLNKIDSIKTTESNYAGYNYFNYNNVKEIDDRLYASLEQKIIFKEKFMTIGNLVTLLNKDKEVMVVDTVYLKISNYSADLILGNEVKDSSNNYFKAFRIMNKENLKRYKEAFAKRKAIFEKENAKQIENEKKYERELVKFKVIATKEVNDIDYYAPINITKLGWINCDWPIKNETISVDADLPITFNNLPIRYYIVMRNLNGMLQGTKTCINGAFSFDNKMPVGEKATIISITEKNGDYYLAENKLIFNKSTKKISLCFNKVNISAIKEKLFARI
jgi:hypothetical protein